MNPEIEVKILKNNLEERKISDDKYSPMIVKSVVFGLVSIILIGVIGVVMGVFKDKTNVLINPSQQDVLQGAVINSLK